MTIIWAKTYPGGINPNDPATAVTDVWGDNVDTGIQQLYQLPNAKGDLAVATAADTWERLGSGSNDQVLVADSAQATGLKWAVVPTGGLVLLSAIDAKGDLLAGTANDTVARLAVGTDGQFLKAASSQATGLQWSSLAWTDLSTTAAPTAYTPTWTGSGSNPALGNGTSVGEYIQVGKMVLGWFLVTAGSTTTFGTGIYEFGLPSVRATPPGNSVHFGTARVIDGGQTGYVGFVSAASSFAAARINLSSATTSGLEVAVTETTPMLAANTDSWGGAFAYRTA